jgi:hypothetical protein
MDPVRQSPWLSRRAFLAASGGALLLAACGSSKGGAGGSSTTTASGADPQRAGLTGGRLSSDLYASPTPQRFAFALQKDEQFYGGPPATISFTPKGGKSGPPLAAQYRSDGLPENHGVYTVDAVLPTEGIWTGDIEVDGKDVRMYFQVAAQPVAPTVGTKAPVVASPTVANPLGVDPLCTRTDADNNPAPCDLHTQNLADITGRGRPVVVMFATPARCQSRFCGPVLDQLLSLQGQYQDRMDMVHVEIYRSTTGTALVPTLDGWGIMSEPWIYTIDGAGTIQGRLDGAFSTSEIKALLDQLAA